MFDYQYSIHAGKGPVIIINQLTSIYNIPFKIHIHTPSTPVFR